MFAFSVTVLFFTTLFVDVSSSQMPYCVFHRVVFPSTVSLDAPETLMPSYVFVSVVLFRTVLNFDVSASKIPICRLEKQVLVSSVLLFAPDSTMPLVSDWAVLELTVLPWLFRSLMPSPLELAVLDEIVLVSAELFRTVLRFEVSANRIPI